MEMPKMKHWNLLFMKEVEGTNINLAMKDYLFSVPFRLGSKS